MPATKRPRATRSRSSRTPLAPGDDKRAAILAAALVLFGRYGYRRTSIDDLAHETGIAKGTVYLYFETKEGIFRALCESLIARVIGAAAAASAAAAPIGARLRRVLAAKFEYFHRLLHGSPHAGELLDSTNRVSADLIRQADRAYLRIVTRTIAAAVARGELAAGPGRLGAAAAADLLVASAHGAGSDAGQPVPPPVLRRRLDDLVAVVVAALGGEARARRSA
ncbi:MAG: TetR/AcrR family transcriptional regulator [Deltaproteobacteria bacterium]|nr:TetR/AcrR family transcriptional regulator [Deltaproteobacteria bacterium]